MARMNNYEWVWKSSHSLRMGGEEFKALNDNNARRRMINSKKLMGPNIAGHACELHDYIGKIGVLRYDVDTGKYLWEEKYGSIRTVYLVSKKTGAILWEV